MKTSKAFVREADLAEQQIWDKLIEPFEKRRVSHTAAWIRSLANSVGGNPLFLIFEKNAQIAACLPGLVVSLGFLKIFGSPLPGWQTVGMGPVFNKNQISEEEIIALLVPFLEKNYGVHHIELMTDALAPAVMTAAGFTGKPEYTFQMPLFPDAPDTNLKMMKASARRNIKRAGELGLSVRFTTDEDFVREVYEQVTEVFVRGGNVVPFSEKRVAEYFVRMKEAGSLLAAGVYLPDETTCIATGLFTVYDRELLLWMWSHRTAYRWHRPTELMTWTVMREAMARGCTNFDLMGRGNFKAKFGAVMSDAKTRWIRSRYGWLKTVRQAAEKLYRFQQRARGRLRQLR